LQLLKALLKSGVSRLNPLRTLILIGAMLSACAWAIAQPAPVLTWITNSSVKLEQIIGDVD